MAKKKKLTPNQKAYNKEVKRIVKDVLGGDETLLYDLIPEKQTRISKKRIKMLHEISSPLVSLDKEITLNIVTGEIIPQNEIEADLQHPLPSEDNTADMKRLAYDKLMLHIETAYSVTGDYAKEQVRLELDSFIAYYGEDDFYHVIFSMGGEAIELADFVFRGSTQQEVENRTETFRNELLRKLSEYNQEMFDLTDAQSIQNIKEQKMYE